MFLLNLTQVSDIKQIIFTIRTMDECKDADDAKEEPLMLDHCFQGLLINLLLKRERKSIIK